MRLITISHEKALKQKFTDFTGGNCRKSPDKIS